MAFGRCKLILCLVTFTLVCVFGSFAQAGPRIDATGDMIFYVSNTGLDTNDGLTLTTPKRSDNATLALIQNNYDLRGFTFRIQHLASGVCYPPIYVRGPFIGAVQPIRIVGSTTRSAACIDGGAVDAVYVDAGAEIIVEGFTLYSNNVQLHSTGSASRLYYRDIEFMGTPGKHVASEKQSWTYYINQRDDGSPSNYFISGSAINHLYVNGGANAYLTETNNGTCINFTTAVSFTAFASVIQGGNLTAHTNCRVGPNPGGAALWVQWNSVGANASQLPGNTALDIVDASSTLIN